MPMPSAIGSTAAAAKPGTAPERPQRVTNVAPQVGQHLDSPFCRAFAGARERVRSDGADDLPANQSALRCSAGVLFHQVAELRVGGADAGRRRNSSRIQRGCSGATRQPPSQEEWLAASAGQASGSRPSHMAASASRLARSVRSPSGAHAEVALRSPATLGGRVAEPGGHVAFRFEPIERAIERAHRQRAPRPRARFRAGSARHTRPRPAAGRLAGRSVRIRPGARGAPYVLHSRTIRPATPRVSCGASGHCELPHRFG